MDDSALFGILGIAFLVLAGLVEVRQRQRSGSVWSRLTMIVGAVGILELVVAVLLRIV